MILAQDPTLQDFGTGSARAATSSRWPTGSSWR
jgi:hypothetical protein